MKRSAFRGPGRFPRFPRLHGKSRALSLAAALFCALAGQSLAECNGVNLFSALTPAEQKALGARAEAAPFARGNLWRAEKEGQEIVLVGTYHLDDPRHDALMAAITPELGAAKQLLVEAGPEEEAALQRAMAEDPARMFITTGPTLLEQLPPETWKALSEALKARGIPGFLAAKMQPLYATMVLAIPPCKMAALQEGGAEGLDAKVIAAGQELGLEPAALEPYDTVFRIFDALSAEQSLAMIESALAMEGRSEDFAVTLADLYFAGDSRLIWELTRDHAYAQPGAVRSEIDAEMALMEEVLMTRRNQDWIAVLEAAAARGKTVAAFGALHLSGDTGVLQLLAEKGWQIAPMALP